MGKPVPRPPLPPGMEYPEAWKKADRFDERMAIVMFSCFSISMIAMIVYFGWVIITT